MHEKQWLLYYIVGFAITAFLSSILVTTTLLAPCATAWFLGGVLRMQAKALRAFARGYLTWFLLTELQATIIIALPLIGVCLTYVVEVAFGVFLFRRLKLPHAVVLFVLVLPGLALLYLLVLAVMRKEDVSVVQTQLRAQI